MKNMISFSLMVICLMIMQPAFAQQEDGPCRLVGSSCTGTCGTWYWGTQEQNQQPREAGTPKCHKVVIKEDKGKPVFSCHCFLIVTSTRCREEACEEDGCPNVYASAIDAQLGRDPIKGICISQGTGNTKNCACKYEYPKE
jgi:hypothetical protein